MKPLNVPQACLPASLVIGAIDMWQRSDFHPLTCGVDSGHRSLVGQERDGRVVLVCPDCSYVQTHIPAGVLSAGLAMVEVGEPYRIDAMKLLAPNPER